MDDKSKPLGICPKCRETGKGDIHLRRCDREVHDPCVLCGDGAEPGPVEFFLEKNGGLVCFACANRFADSSVVDGYIEAHERASITPTGVLQ